MKPRSVRGQGEVRSPRPALHQPQQHGGEAQVSQGSGGGQVTAAGSSPTSATWRSSPGQSGVRERSGHRGRLFTNLSNMEVKPRSVRGQGRSGHRGRLFTNHRRSSPGQSGVRERSPTSATWRSSPGQSGVRERSGHRGRLFTNLSNMEVKPRSVRGQGEVRSPRPAPPQQHGGQAQVSQGSGRGQVTAAASSPTTGGQAQVSQGSGEVRSPRPAPPQQHGGQVQVSQGSGRGQVTAAGSSPTSATWRSSPGQSGVRGGQVTAAGSSPTSATWKSSPGQSGVRERSGSSPGQSGEKGSERTIQPVMQLWLFSCVRVFSLFRIVGCVVPVTVLWRCDLALVSRRGASGTAVSV